jgi:hypothetical protein
MEGKQANWSFNIYAYEDNAQTDHLGGANDLPSAVSLAAAHYVSKQSSNPVTDFGVGVDEDEVGLVAYVGWHQGD